MLFEVPASPRPRRLTLAALCGGLALWLAPAALGAPRNPEPGATGAEAEASVGDLDALSRQNPGREGVESVRRSLTVPSPESRWRGLPEFGRELFRDTLQRFTPIENTPVGPDYVLGPGDNLLVFVSGLSDTSYSLTLDREGKVFLPRVGSVFLWGLSFADAEALLRGRIATVLRNARVQVSMGRVRAMDVFVLGAVTRPGKYTLAGLATAFHALSAAGGPSSLGSLRDIRVLRANREVARLDLYPFLLRGDRGNDIRLQAGDVVFAGLAQARVGIQGAVVRPGVYESIGPLTLRALLGMAGGPSPFADLSRIRIERVDANGGFRLQDLPLDHGHGLDPDSLTLSAYDLVTVLQLNERMRNLVTLDGFVRHPGEYELLPAMSLSQLLTRDRVLPEADLDHAELRRVDPVSFAVQVRPFSIRALWEGRGDLPLQPLDAVSVFSSARLPRSVVLDGEVVRPGTYAVVPGERLSQVLARAGGVTPRGYLRAAVFTRRSAADRERRFVREFVQRQRLELARQEAALLQSGDSTGAVAALRSQARMLDALERQSDPGRVALRLDESGRWMGTDRDPVLEDGDRLVVPARPGTVTVLGSVMNPGTVMARRGASFADYVRLVGGPSRQADAGRGYVLKANGEALPRQGAGRIEPGDAIVVPPRELTAPSAGRSLLAGVRLVAELATTAALVLAVTR